MTGKAKSGRINPNAISVILALHRHEKKGMTSWQVKKQAKLHERTVERALKRLSSDGRYVKTAGKTTKNGIIYQITEGGLELVRNLGEVS